MIPSRHRATVLPAAHPRRWWRGALAAAVAGVVTLGMVASVPAHGAAPGGTVYYVSASGSDSNSGKSPSRAWRTIARVNAATLHGGDKVLFQGGATFSDAALDGNSGGVAGAPITYGSYGGNANLLPLGVWIKRHDFLVFDHLTANRVVGRGNDITIRDSDLGNWSIAVSSVGGNRWHVLHNYIHDTTDSGIIADVSETGTPAYNWVVDGNTITRTGTGPETFGTHGMYLKVVNAVVTNNTITNFHDSGISVRYGNSTLRNNHISGGNTGITWFQYDPVARTSHWTSNTIADTTTGIYVSGWDPTGGTTRESFVIRDNDITLRAGSSDYMNLQPTTGTYTVSSPYALHASVPECQPPDC